MNIKEIDLIENKETREQVIDRVEVLDKVGDLLLLPNTEYATTEQVATYYEVGIEAINSIVNRHRDEFNDIELIYLSQNEVINNIQNNNKIQKYQGYICIEDIHKNIKIANRGVRLFSIDGIIKVAFYLTESEIAQKVRTEILKIDPKLYYNLSNAELLRFKKYEKDMEYFLKALFGDDLVKTQVLCGDYLLDFVIDDTVHIEIDEYGHSGYDKIKEKEREKYILNNTDYWTFRFNPHEDTKFELLYDIFELYENIGFPKIA